MEKAMMFIKRMPITAKPRSASSEKWRLVLMTSKLPVRLTRRKVSVRANQGHGLLAEDIDLSTIDTLLSPVILFFILGALAAAARSDLSVPEPIAKGMSLYLMAAIGLKGGVQVSAAGMSSDMVGAAIAGMGLSFGLPFVAFALLRSWGGLDRMNSGAVAAHYGSVSIVTFVTASEALTRSGAEPAGYMVAVLALMETPAILTGLLLAQNGLKQKSGAPGGHIWREVFLNGSVVLLLGAFFVGLVIGKDKYAAISPVFTTGFSGILCLFLLVIVVV